VSRAAKYPSLTERAEYYDLEKAARQGLLLPYASSLGLEDALIYNESDLITRARLLGYYSKKMPAGHKDKRLSNRTNHILWFIQNVPDCKFAGNDYLKIDRKMHLEQFEEVKRSWSEAIAERPDNVQIKINTAMFLFQDETTTSVQILRSILKDSPANSWAIRLMKLHGHKYDYSFADIDKAPPNFNLEKWRIYADQIHLDTMVFDGEYMPPDAAQTLEAVLAKYPEDINARAELIGYYHRRWKRQNVLRIDPDSLEKLIQHVLWCIENIPGSQFVSNSHGFLSIDKKIAPTEHALLFDAWSEKVKKYPDNAAILTSAASFFAECGQIKKSERLVKKVQKIAQQDKNIEHMLKFGVGNARLRSAKESTTKGLANSLEEISVETGYLGKTARIHPYSFAEWASEVGLSRAHLAGVYHWVPASSIANLESILHADSTDIYNRAKIIGSYDKYYSWIEYSKASTADLGLNEAQKFSHLQHMRWFIENIPESKFIATFYLSPIKKHNPGLYRLLRNMLLNQASANEKDTTVLINVAVALSRTDKAQAKRLARKILKQSPGWSLRILALLGLKIPDPDVKAVLKQHAFKPGKRELRFSKIARLVNLSRCSFEGRSLPLRTIWSNERALECNPNDLVLRAELLEAYDNYDQFHVHFNGHTPDIVPALVKHNLWFIHHIPDYYLYSSGCWLNIHGWRKEDRYLSDHAIVLQAAKLQMRAYPTDLNVGLALNHYYPLGNERAAIASLRNLEKLYPKNKKLQQRFGHLRSLLDGRNYSRKLRSK